MISQQLKNIYFAVNRYLTLPNHYFNKIKYAVFKNDDLYLHLGSGDDYKPDMINVEGNIAQKKDLWLDFNNGLPFKTNSVSFIFCCHTLEHFYPHQAISVIKEIHRVLKPGSIARIAVPSFDHALEIIQGIHTSKWPRNFEDGKSQAINYLFCEGQHKFAYTFEIFKRFAKEAGFKDQNIFHYSKEFGIAPKKYGKVTISEDDVPDSLVVELTKE